MSRKGCPNKIHSGIYYPRKCDDCDYISNNPPMFYYHKKTHDSLENKNCRCGFPALYIGTQGIYRCNQKPQLCPQYLLEHSERVKKQWIGDNKRKEDTANSIRERLHNEENYLKSKKTKRSKTGLLTEERRKIFRRYAYACRKLAQQWAEDNGYELGQQTFHVDHIYSVLDGFKNEVPPSIISHPKNLRILEAKKNSSKGSNSEISLEELYSLSKD